jgi:hypothetical protein
VDCEIRRLEDVGERMKERDNGSGKIGGSEIGEGPYDCGSRQPILAEKRVSLTLKFKIAFREITPETAVEVHQPRDPAGVMGDAALMADVEREGRLLGALLEDEEALRQFIACAVIDEVATGGGDLLRQGLKAKNEEEALRPLIEVLGGEVAEYYSGVRKGMFDENIELLIYSTPVKCLAVRIRVVEMSEEASGSDNFLM